MVSSGLVEHCPQDTVSPFLPYDALAVKGPLPPAGSDPVKCVHAPSLAFSTQDPAGNPRLLPATPE